MRLLLHRLPFLSFLLLAWSVLCAHAQIPGLPGASDPAQFRSEQVQARLVAHMPDGLAAHKTVWVGLQLTHSPHWHTYWKNPGDSGLPTQLDWRLPAGVSAGDIRWPTPQKFPLPPLANYGYDGEVLLPVALTLPADWQGNRLEVGLHASWLVCKTECIPEEGDFRLTLQAEAPLTVDGRRFEQAAQAAPQDMKPGTSLVEIDGSFLRLTLDNLPPAWRGKTLEVFPEEPNLVEPGGAWTQSWHGTQWQARVPQHSMRSESPDHMTVVLSAPSGGHAPAGVRLSLPVKGTWPPAASAPTTLSPELEAALSRNASAASQATAPAIAPASTGTWLLALASALLGGLILNLMPCVFPVLAIKVLSFSSPQGQPRSHLASGLAYTAGVVLSFLALGGVLMALRMAGEQLGWGFQLQSPGVVAALAVLFTLIGLNLAGLFELGSWLPSSLASLELRHPVLDALLTGVLATAIASPCTAPFMGASLGLAVGLPTAQALAVFAAIGLGMALPYLVASGVPAVARLLPRPGAWMNTFKQLMAFPMFATVVWLVWVLGQQTGINGAAALLGWLVALTLVLWAWQQPGRSRWWLGSASALLWTALTVAWAPLALTEEPATPATTSEADTQPLAAGVWHPWSAERMAQVRRSGQTLLVDYTAAWCVTCQYNKRTVLTRPELLADLARGQVMLLRADWTRRDPAVTAALAEVGRNGVPTYAVYRAGQPPQLLSELPSLDEVRQAALPH
ncbi:MAG TPA: thioredoxin family protein [Burkholderiaceae bacterium]|nr:thioredoxin family protein [Burkholderiaceae bacterium]